MTKKLLHSTIVFVSIIVIIFTVDFVLFIRLRIKRARTDIPTEEIQAEHRIVKRNNFRYKPLYKNPFLFLGFERDTVKADSIRKEEVLTLKGIVLGPGEPVVVIGDKFGNVSILKKGETFNEITVVSVKKNSVKVTYKNKSYSLDIWEE